MLYELDGVRPTLADDQIFIADSASVIGKVTLAKGSSVWFSAVLRGDNDPILVGENTNIQDGTMCHTDIGCPLTLGDNVTIGHQVMLHGCTIGDGSLVGMGATILNKAVIGKNSIVGAGALVTEGKTFPDGSLIMGVPAKKVRDVTENDLRMLDMSAKVYVANSKRFKAGLKPIKD